MPDRRRAGPPPCRYGGGCGCPRSAVADASGDVRRGHIPGSRNVTAWEILDRTTQCYRPLPELRSKAGSALQAERVVTYCGAGAAAVSLANVLVHLGHPHVALYEGGLLEWCADRHLPLETSS